MLDLLSLRAPSLPRCPPCSTLAECQADLQPHRVHQLPATRYPGPLVSASFFETLKLLILLRPDVTLQLEAALADPRLPYHVLLQRLASGAIWSLTRGLLRSRGHKRLQPELTTSHGDFNETALLFICVAASVARGHGTRA